MRCVLVSGRNLKFSPIMLLQLVEKLSATAPDGQTKVKILSAIADEHNVKWDPMSFGGKDSTPPSDLLVWFSCSKYLTVHVEFFVVLYYIFIS